MEYGFYYVLLILEAGLIGMLIYGLTATVIQIWKRRNPIPR